MLCLPSPSAAFFLLPCLHRQALSGVTGTSLTGLDKAGNSLCQKNRKKNNKKVLTSWKGAQRSCPSATLTKGSRAQACISPQAPHCTPTHRAPSVHTREAVWKLLSWPPSVTPLKTTIAHCPVALGCAPFAGVRTSRSCLYFNTTAPLWLPAHSGFVWFTSSPSNLNTHLQTSLWEGRPIAFGCCSDSYKGVVQ